MEWTQNERRNESVLRDTEGMVWRNIAMVWMYGANGEWKVERKLIWVTRMWKEGCVADQECDGWTDSNEQESVLSDPKWLVQRNTLRWFERMERTQNERLNKSVCMNDTDERRRMRNGRRDSSVPRLPRCTEPSTYWWVRSASTRPRRRATWPRCTRASGGARPRGTSTSQPTPTTSPTSSPGPSRNCREGQSTVDYQSVQSSQLTDVFLSGTCQIDTVFSWYVDRQIPYFLDMQTDRYHIFLVYWQIDNVFSRYVDK